jgi:hypothetical protein
MFWDAEGVVQRLCLLYASQSICAPIAKADICGQAFATTHGLFQMTAAATRSLTSAHSPMSSLTGKIGRGGTAGLTDSNT